jgi:hypothetical protein
MPVYGAGSKCLGRGEKEAEWRKFHAPHASGNSHCTPTYGHNLLSALEELRGSLGYAAYSEAWRRTIKAMRDEYLERLVKRNSADQPVLFSVRPPITRTRSVLRIVVLAVVVKVDYIANNVSVRVDKRDVLSDDHILVVLRSG